MWTKEQKHQGSDTKAVESSRVPLPGSHSQGHSELPSLWVRDALCQLMARLGPGRPNQHIWERKSCSHTPLAMKPAAGIDKDSSCEGFRAQMSTTSSSESARPATAVQTACELQALCTLPVRTAQDCSTTLLKKHLNAHPARQNLSVLIIL